MEDAARDYGRLNQIMQEKDQIQTQLDFKMERWLYLNELQEKIESQNAGAKA